MSNNHELSIMNTIQVPLILHIMLAIMLVHRFHLDREAFGLKNSREGINIAFLCLF